MNYDYCIGNDDTLRGLILFAYAHTSHVMGGKLHETLHAKCLANVTKNIPQLLPNIKR